MRKHFESPVSAIQSKLHIAEHAPVKYQFESATLFQGRHSKQKQSLGDAEGGCDHHKKRLLSERGVKRLTLNDSSYHVGGLVDVFGK